MINLKMLRKMGLMVALLSQGFAANPCISTEEPFYRKWRGCDMPGERGAVKGDSRVVHERYARGFLSFNTYLNLPKGIYILKFDNNGSADNCQMDRMINFDGNLGYYDDGRHMGHMNGFSYVAGYNLSKNTQNDNCQILYSNFSGASILFRYEENVRANLCCFSYGGSVVINSIEIIRVGDNGFSSHPMMRDIPSPFYQMMRSHFMDEVHRSFFHAFSALGDAVINHINTQGHIKNFSDRAKFNDGHPGYEPLSHACKSIVDRFTGQENRSNGLESLITQVNDTQSARITSLEAQLQQALSGIETLKDEVNRLKSENEKLKVTVNVHQAMVEHIERKTTPLRKHRDPSVSRSRN